MEEEEKKYDKDPKRATYKTMYPLSISKIIFKNIQEYKEKIGNSKRLENLTIKFNYTKENNKQCTFSQCQFFFNLDEINAIKAKDTSNDLSDFNVIERITFQNCTFDHCFLGSVDFKNVRFENCKFNNCDFSNSRFDYCVFDNCSFSKCSAYHPEFINTEITAKFLSGIVLLSENYEEMTDEIKYNFCYMKLGVAKKVYNSNNSIDNHALSDDSLLELKRAEVSFLIMDVKKQFSNHQLCSGLINVINLSLKTLNLFLTGGGTSLKKLLIYTFLFILGVNFYFSSNTITDCIFDFSTSPNFFINYLQWIPRSTSIVLGYGYTSFQPKSFLSHIVLNCSVIVGLCSYALLISVLMRKIYK